MIGFIIGLFVGGFIGIAVSALIRIASKADNNAESALTNTEV